MKGAMSNYFSHRSMINDEFHLTTKNQNLNK